MESQILSNFKLFSKTSLNELGVSELVVDKMNLFLYGHYFFAGIIIVICGFIYYYQDRIKHMLNNMIGKLWVSTHITSEGVSSTYVPAKFSKSI
jgi:hypothetical protein